MKIDSQRSWHLVIKRTFNSCLELKEIHHSSENGWPSTVIIPLEAIPGLIKQLEKYKEKTK